MLLVEGENNPTYIPHNNFQLVLNLVHNISFHINLNLVQNIYL